MARKARTSITGNPLFDALLLGQSRRPMPGAPPAGTPPFLPPTAGAQYGPLMPGQGPPPGFIPPNAGAQYAQMPPPSAEWDAGRRSALPGAPPAGVPGAGGLPPFPALPPYAQPPALPQLAPPPERDFAQEGRRPAEAAGLLTLLAAIMGRGRAIPQITGGFLQGAQAGAGQRAQAAQQEWEQKQDVALQQYGLSRQSWADQMTGTDREYRHALGQYESDVEGYKTRGVEEDRERRAALAETKAIQEAMDRADARRLTEIRNILSTATPGRLTPEAQQAMAARLRELGVENLPDEFVNEMTPQQRETLDLAARGRDLQERGLDIRETQGNRQADLAELRTLLSTIIKPGATTPEAEAVVARYMREKGLIDLPDNFLRDMTPAQSAAVRNAQARLELAQKTEDRQRQQGAARIGLAEGRFEWEKTKPLGVKDQTAYVGKLKTRRLAILSKMNGNIAKMQGKVDPISGKKERPIGINTLAAENRALAQESQQISDELLAMELARSGRQGAWMLHGMAAPLSSRLGRLMRDYPQVGITDGYRSSAQQADVFRRKPGLAAPPGRSNHETGMAADITGYQNISDAELAKYGLYRPMKGGKGKKYEPWHVEPIRNWTGHHSSLQPRTAQGQFNGPPKVQVTEKKKPAAKPAAKKDTSKVSVNGRVFTVKELP